MSFDDHFHVMCGFTKKTLNESSRTKKKLEINAVQLIGDNYMSKANRHKEQRDEEVYQKSDIHRIWRIPLLRDLALILIVLLFLSNGGGARFLGYACEVVKNIYMYIDGQTSWIYNQSGSLGL